MANMSALVAQHAAGAGRGRHASVAARARLPALALLLGLAWVLVGSCTDSSFALWRLPASGVGGVEPSPAGSAQRRSLLGGLGLAAAVPAGPALAYEAYKDTNLGFQFTYPTGLQKSDSKLYNIFLRDIIEPLESVGAKVTDTKRTSLADIGDARAVAEKLLEDVIPAGAPSEIIKAESKTDKQGRRYDVIEYAYQWKFDAALAKTMGRNRFQLHNKALVTIDRKKQYLVIAGCEERRWPVQGDQLGLAVDTFRLIFD